MHNYEEEQVVDTQPSEALTTLQEMDQTEPTETVQEQAPQQQYYQQEETDRERNLRRMREQLQQAQRERDEALRYAQEMKAREEQEDLEFNVAPDEILEGRHAAKLQKKFKRHEELMRQQQQQMQALIIESKLKASYPDFDHVVTKENIEVLSAQYPEIAQTIHSSPDLYNKAASAYTIIKNLNLANNTQSYYQKEKEIAHRNAAKPKPLAAIAPQQGNTPLSRVNDFGPDLTPDAKKAIYKEMQDIIRRPR